MRVPRVVRLLANCRIPFALLNFTTERFICILLLAYILVYFDRAEDNKVKHQTVFPTE